MVPTAITFDVDGKSRPQRALVLQGGGALGAYEAGAFRALYEFISENPLFDIVAGISIGAINAAILVSHVIDNNSWEGSVEKLLGFWKYIASWDKSELLTFMGFNAWWDNWWNGLRSIDKSIASPEAARRYCDRYLC
jgi:NTE family protein